MMIALDSYYTIGKLHLFCEDYVGQGWQPLPYVILADGCSAAPDSDLGARLLVLTARRLLPRFALKGYDLAERTVRHWSLGRRIIRRAARQVRDLGVDTAVLDATLLIAWCDGEAIHSHLYGDGCIATRQADGSVRAIQIEYAENAPFYLSYLLDAKRCALYCEAVGNAQMAQSIHEFGEGEATVRQAAFDAPIVFSFPLATFPTVAVATDGLHSLMNVETGKRVEILEVARRLLDFPNLEAGFMKRQIRSVLVEYGQQKVFNLDDVGMGVFVRTN
ncbi:MAG: protein phosphatase 2C domain-containing protein [Candidatus Competibacteraceae bacterium]|nr:protein phosphatase 2C domain-containing protein [Candidatus Competibacteraceae bacterium]